MCFALSINRAQIFVKRNTSRTDPDYVRYTVKFQISLLLRPYKRSSSNNRLDLEPRVYLLVLFSLTKTRDIFEYSS